MMTKRLLIRLLPLGILFGMLALSQPAMAIDAPHNFKDNPPVNPMECADCHAFHGTSYPSLLENLCESCHFSGGPAPEMATHSSRTTDTGYGDWEVDCWGCHDPHTQEQDTWPAGPHAGKLVRRYMGGGAYGHIKQIDPADSTPEYYEDIGGPVSRDVTSSIIEYKSNTEFVDSDGSSSDDICRVCHESTGNFSTTDNTHTVGATANPGDNCTTCHNHVDGFKASGGGCTGCHGLTQPNGTGDYRRQVAGTGGDFERTAHHVTDGTTTEVIVDADCEVCHDQTDHQDQLGSPAEITVLLNDPDGGTSWTYDETGSSIEGFCTGCHDSDGANGNTTPFTDGRTPPDIEATWAASSHGSSGVLASDKCLTCHGGADSTTTDGRNAHGSANAKLLSSLVAGKDLSALNVEEELCYACHDGSLASTDIETQFNGATNYQDATSGTGLLINQRHDVSDADQAYSGSVVECTNCHNPHVATSANKTIDPDTPTTAYSLTYDTSNSWTGPGNKSYTRDGYNFTYYDTTADYNPMNPIGCTGSAATTGPAIADGGNSGDDSAASGGTYTGPDDGTYTLEVTTGGASGVLTCTTGITGDDCNGGQTYGWTDATPIAIGGNGVEITLTDGPGAPSSIGSAVAGSNSGDDTGTSGGTFTGGSDDTYTVTVSTGGAPGAGGFNIGPAVDPAPANDDSATSGGTYTGGSEGTYTVTVTTGGRARDAVIDYISDIAGDTSGNVCGGSGPQCSFDNPFAVGSNGVTITITQGARDFDTGDDWTIDITSGGSNPQITVTSTLGDSSGPTDVTAFGSSVAVGTEGVTISFTDGGDGVLTAGDTWTIAATAALPGDGLTLGDIWTIDVTAASAGCSTNPEPDMITFCLVCHDGNVPAGVTMNADMVNIATAYRDVDYHGAVANSGSSGNGFMKAPWADVPSCDDGSGTGTSPGDGFCDSELPQHYAALQCTTCHDGHGSDNIFHLRSSMTVRGQVLSVGGGPGSGQEANPFTAASDYGPGDTTYLLPCFDGNTQVSCTNPAGVQQDHKWGAFCSFCHDLQTHGQAEDNTCRTGHKHGGGAF
jgi:predicted CXXCH cytochrome family protein